MAVAPPDQDPYGGSNPYIGSGDAPGAAPPTFRSPLAGGGFIGSGGSYTQPDWDALLKQYMSPYQSIYDAQIAALQGRTAAQTQLANQRFSGSDTSTMARLGTEHDDFTRNIIHSLAGRGLINSGDKGFQQRREALRYKRAETDASNQLLDYLIGLQNSLADAQSQGLLGLQTQRLNTASTIGSLYQPTYTSNMSKVTGGQFGTPTAAASTDPSSIFKAVYG